MLIVFIIIWNKEKASGKSRQGGPQTKETVQEYIGGSDTVTEDSALRDYVVTRARLMAAKCVLYLFFFSRYMIKTVYGVECFFFF